MNSLARNIVSDMMATIEQTMRELYTWASTQDFVGHDPHDLLNSPFLRRVRNPLARLVALQAGRRSIINLHTLFRVPHSENPKALALLLTGLLRAKESIIPQWADDAQQLGNRLLRLMDRTGGWGYSFPWQSRTHFLPAGTPNIVTTSFAGNALIALHRQFPSEAWLGAIRQSVDYVLSIKGSDDAFGYARNDPQIVFNASLLGAEFLVNAIPLFDIVTDRTFIEQLSSLSNAAAQFVAGHQRTDGGWNYGLEPSQQWEDSFHTGFVICSMRRIAEAVDDAHLAESARRGFDYYRKTYLEPDGAVKYFPHACYPIDAHAVGQGMVTFSDFGDRETARRIASWAIRHLRSPNGYFYYQRHRLFTNKIPYLRWSNAWMFRGLAEIAGEGVAHG